MAGPPLVVSRAQIPRPGAAPASRHLAAAPTEHRVLGQSTSVEVSRAGERVGSAIEQRCDLQLPYVRSDS